MKKLICFLLALSMMLTLAACGAYTEGSTATRDTFIQITDPVDPEAEDVSSVTLTLNGRSIVENPGFYELFLSLDIYAQWSDGYTTVVAQFDEEGVARATSLDGDYHVTLLAKRQGEELDSSSAFSQTIGDYTYNINGHSSTNDTREIEVPMYRILAGDGPGTDWMYPYVKELSDQGVYKITLDSPDQVVMCRFAPEFSGVYTIESWVSVADDNINPIYDRWYGSVAWASYGYSVDDGSAEGTYTKNFKDVRTVTDEEIGNVFIFGVHGTAKDGHYPIEVYISVLKTAELHERDEEIFMVPTDLHYALDPKGDNPNDPNDRPAFLDYWQPQAGGTYLLDDSKCKLWPVEEGGDGFYHVYDPEMYPETNGWGPTLYARITSPTLAGYSLQNVEYMGQGNNMLTLKKGNIYHRYKQFIEGFKSLAEFRPNYGGSYYCVGDCQCHEDSGPNDMYACEEYCEGCSMDCTQVKPELYGTPGYANAVNSDGVYPVTEELKVFLQLFAECHNLFCDGTGQLEEEGLNSDQESMWLWAVGYYENDQGGKCEMGGLVPKDLG